MGAFWQLHIFGQWRSCAIVASNHRDQEQPMPLMLTEAERAMLDALAAPVDANRRPEFMGAVEKELDAANLHPLLHPSVAPFLGRKTTEHFLEEKARKLSLRAILRVLAGGGIAVLRGLCRGRRVRLGLCRFGRRRCRPGRIWRTTPG
jgi:hypothetical protein